MGMNKGKLWTSASLTNLKVFTWKVSLDELMLKMGENRYS